MRSLLPKTAALLVISGLYWQIAVWIAGADEPWDAASYWYFWYPFSVGLAGIAGLFFKRQGWLAGTVLTFAQLPVMWINNPVAGPLYAVGLLLLCVLALPCVLVSTIAGRKADQINST